MLENHLSLIEEAKAAALEVLLKNVHGPFQGLPRTATWGYPEPYTRDLLISIFGIAATENSILLESIKKVLNTLALNQSFHGHIPSLVHDKNDRGASDTTPLFLIATSIYRKLTGNTEFLSEAVDKAINWMEYQSPSDQYLIAQQPTSDWRDELWVPGYGLFVNTLSYCYLRLLNKHKKANFLRNAMSRFVITDGLIHKHESEGLVVEKKPYFALWSYKIYSSDRFDLLGNSLAILSGIASPTRANDIILWIEEKCNELRGNGELGSELPPNFFPYIQKEDLDYLPRYRKYNNPGDYHNGGIWPFVCGFYIAALVAVKKYNLASEKLLALTHTVKMAKDAEINYGFNEWHKAQNNSPMGQNWQSWSAALYLYAAKCVEAGSTPFFDSMRAH